MSRGNPHRPKARAPRRQDREAPTVELGLRFGLADGDSREPVVEILVDGRELIEGLDTTLGYLGFDPADLLDSGALLPGDDPQRIGMYRCSCSEPGCDCVALIIERIDDRVRWSDARHMRGVYGRRPVGHVALPEGGTPVELGASWFDADGRAPAALDDIWFDADQYLFEVGRATADRSWESPLRRAADRLRTELDQHRDELQARGWRLGWVEASYRVDGNLDVSLHDRAEQVIVSLTPTSDQPEADVDALVAILRGESAAWPIIWRSRLPDHMTAAVDDELARSGRPSVIGGTVPAMGADLLA